MRFRKVEVAMPLLAARMKRGRGDDQVHSDGGEKGTLQARSRLPGGGVTTRNQMSLTSVTDLSHNFIRSPPVCLTPQITLPIPTLSFSTPSLYVCKESAASPRDWL